MAETLTIDHVGHRGDGVAQTPAGQRYIPFALPGESVDVDGGNERTRLLRIITPSPDRIAPLCTHFGTCGGCAIQHWAPDAYLAWKRGLVVATLVQHRIAVEVAPIVDAHGAGRRRLTLHARRGTDGVVHVGFAEAGSHKVVPIDICPILEPALDGALGAARDIAAALLATNKQLDIQITAADEGLDIDIRGSGPLEGRLVGALSTLASRHRIARLTRHGELIVQHRPPTLAMGRARVVLPPGSFLQATAAGEAALAQHVSELVGGVKSVADLFCGVGPFALRLAEQAKVAAFDSEAPAIDALAKAAATTPRLKPVSATTRDLFRRPLTALELNAYEAVVFDPPRQGAETQVRELARSKVRNVIAVSCNAATFARDAGILFAGGYRMGKVTPIDQFRHTPHVELVAGFSR